MRSMRSMLGREGNDEVPGVARGPENSYQGPLATGDAVATFAREAEQRPIDSLVDAAPGANAR
jgi:hypothetical protein